MAAPDDGRETVVLFWKSDLLEGGEPWEVPELLQHALNDRRMRLGAEAFVAGKTAYEQRNVRKHFDAHGNDVKITEDN